MLPFFKKKLRTHFKERIKIFYKSFKTILKVKNENFVICMIKKNEFYIFIVLKTSITINIITF